MQKLVRGSEVVRGGLLIIHETVICTNSLVLAKNISVHERTHKKFLTGNVLATKLIIEVFSC